MKIKVGLNAKSIKNAINALETAKKQLQGEMLDEFYKECYNYFVSRANYYLLSSGIGDLVIAEIQSSWHFEKIVGGVKFTNDAEKAVYVEFGVGIVGGDNKHPNADMTGYKYDVPSKSKLVDGSWMFRAYEDELDIPQNAIVGSTPKSDGRLKILTSGTKGCFYAFNALEDLRLEYKNIWERIKIKYWG
jgi:hypothetical protein